MDNKTNNKPRILIIDDETFYIDVLVDILQDIYSVSIAKTGSEGLQRATGNSSPDLILLDILMSDMDGYEVCRQLKENPETADIPVIFLTIKSEVDDEVRGFKLGAVDYITKPISPPIVLSRVKTHLTLAQSKLFLKKKNHLLEENVAKRTKEIAKTQDVAILCMASLAEARDNETGNHIRRTQEYIRLLSMHLKDHPGYAGFLNDFTIELLYRSAPLHDVGKVGVPDKILLKKGKLDTDEWEEMKKHAVCGYEALVRAEKDIGTTTFLYIAKEITLTHHEKWDGTGYPQGLKENEIPISGRLMALADVYDALISKRVYKEAYSHEKAMRIILEERGAHFDPGIADAFALLQDQFRVVAHRYAD